LSIVGSQELDTHIWQAWDVDHNANNLLVEARPSWDPSGSLKSLICYPQFTFERKVADLRGDAEEMMKFGLEDFETVMRKAVRNAYYRHRAGKRNALHLERIRSSTIHAGFRLPPRVFTRHTIWE